MKVVITDVNVFFDIISVNALPEFFALDYEINTTDFGSWVKLADNPDRWGVKNPTSTFFFFVPKNQHSIIQVVHKRESSQIKAA